jgi:amidase
MAGKEFLPNSFMSRRGAAKGVAGKQHILSIADQGSFEYVYGPYSEARLEIDPGDVVVVETEDAFGGAITSESDRPSQKLTFPFLNPQSGPIRVRGAEKGDCLAIAIHSVENRGGFGATCLIPEFGGLVGTNATALLNPPLPEVVRRVRVNAGGVHWNDRLIFPYEPFIGTIGVSPQIEAISTLQPDYHGGNMDLPDVRPGAVIYIPVHTPGGLLFVGDCHATQGDGELTGVAIEQRATVTLQVDLIKAWSFVGPRIETNEFIMAIGSARPLEDAARIAYRELVRWMTADFDFEELDAYMVLGQVGRMRLGNMVDPKYTMGASIRKSYLVPARR